MAVEEVGVGHELRVGASDCADWEPIAAVGKSLRVELYRELFFVGPVMDGVEELLELSVDALIIVFYRFLDNLFVILH